MEIWILGGGYSPTSDLDLGKKVGNLDFFWGGYSPTSDLDLGKKVGNLDFILQLRGLRGGGGVFSNFGFGLRKKSWKFGFLGGGVFSNFGFGLRKKSWKFGFWGGYSPTSDLDLGKKVGNLDFGGGILQLRIWT